MPPVSAPPTSESSGSAEHAAAAAWWVEQWGRGTPLAAGPSAALTARVPAASAPEGILRRLYELSLVMEVWMAETKRHFFVLE